MNDAEPGDLATEANAATEMLGSVVFNKAFETMNAQIVDQILATPPEADAEREVSFTYISFQGGRMKILS